jgi:hypothetical protein
VEVFHRLWVQDVKTFILVGALSPLGGRMRKRKKNKENKSPWGSRVSPGLDLPCWLCNLLQLLGAIKG